MKLETQEWLKFANNDVLACKKLASEPMLTGISAFHAQQAVEKSFKAILVENGIKVPKIHSLVRLYEKIQNLILFEVDTAILEKLEELYIDTRYPGDLGLLPGGRPDVSLAQELCLFANYIYDQTVLTVSND